MDLCPFSSCSLRPHAIDNDSSISLSCPEVFERSSGCPIFCEPSNMAVSPVQIRYVSLITTYYKFERGSKRGIFMILDSAQD